MKNAVRFHTGQLERARMNHTAFDIVSLDRLLPFFLV